MTERTQNILAFGFLLILLCAVGLAFSKCDGVNRFPDSGKTKTTDSVITVTQPPPTTGTTPAILYIDTGSVQYKAIWRTRYRDTGSIRVDTFFVGLPPFSLRGEAFVTSKRDTIVAEYQFPANKFIYDCRYSPDTVLTITNTVTIPPQRLQFGAQFGVGAAYCMDGVIRPAAFVGVGINWRF